MSQIDDVVQKAVSAFPVYREKKPAEIAKFLTTIAERITALGDTLIKTAMEETGLPEARLTGERGRTTGQLNMFARVVTDGWWVQARIDRALPDRKPIPRPDLRNMLVPLGPVAVFGASNFPFAYSTAGGDTASALAAGCPVIVKAHPSHPRTSDLVAGAIASAIKDCGMPDGTFQHIHGGVETGLELVKHHGIKAVGFTGSLKAGRALFDACAARPEPIPVYAEMGSVNPVVLFPGALAGDPGPLATSLATSLTMSMGQFCTNPGLMFAVEGPGTKAFLDVLADRVKAVEPAPMLNPGIHAAFGSGVQKFTGVKGVFVAATSSKEAAAAHREGRPTVMTVPAEVFLANPLLREELFGPSSLVVLCKDLNQLRDTLSVLPGQLTGTVHGTDQEIKEHPGIMAVLRDRVGRIVYRGVPTGVEVSDAIEHGGPYPASTDSRTSSVGTHAIERWVRPLAWQNCPDALLPEALQNANPLKILRLVDGAWTTEQIT